MESKIRASYDANLALYAPGSAAIVATGTGTKVDINRITKSPRPPGAAVGALDGRFGMLGFKAIVHLTAGLAVSAGETYTLQFCTYDADGTNEKVQDAHVVVLADLGATLVYAFDVATLKEQHANAALFTLKVLLAGAAPSVTLWAFLAPLQNH